MVDFIVVPRSQLRTNRAQRRQQARERRIAATKVLAAPPLPSKTGGPSHPRPFAAAEQVLARMVGVAKAQEISTQLAATGPDGSAGAGWAQYLSYRTCLSQDRAQRFLSLLWR